MMLKKVTCLLLFLSLSATALVNAQSLWVAGITNPSAANGIYVKQSGNQYGYSYWKHQTQNYYIYNHVYSGDGKNYWNIDMDYDDADVYFYSQSAATSPVGLTWSAWSGTGNASVIVYTVTPEIDIRGNRVVIASGDATPSFGDHTQFGSADVTTGTATRTFKIYNMGAGALSLTGSSPYVTISGANASDFSVTAIPSNSIASSDSTSFEVTFNPSAVGNRIATISLANNDADENPYTFSIQGYGFTSGNLVVSGITTPAAANGSYIHQGVMFNFQYWKHATLNYYLYNDEYSSARYWNIDNNMDDAACYFFSKDHSDDPSPVNVVAWDTAGTLGGKGTPVVMEAVAVAHIAVMGNFIPLNNGDTIASFTNFTDFGSADVSTGSVISTFKIKNRGGATLTLTGSSPYIALSGTNASDFSVTAIPSSSIAAGDSTTFQITFNPSALGIRSASVTIASNDADVNFFTFSICGNGFTPQNLVVSGITNPAASNGNYVHQGVLYNFQYWKHESANYYIYNDDWSGTRYWNIDNNTNDSASFFWSKDHSADFSPVNVLAWDTAGTFMHATGTPVVRYSGPEMDVLGNNISIVDGDATPSSTDHTDFGSANIFAETVVRTFTIKNTGTTALTLTGSSPYITISGTNAAEFSVTSIPSPSIASGDSTSVQITFNPSAAGVRSATVSLTNNDIDENPYNFSIQGTGIISNITFTDGSAFNQTMNPGSTNQPIGRLRLKGDASGASLTAASIKLNNTRTGLSNLKLWSSPDTSFGGDTQLGSTIAADPGNGNSVSFTGFSSAVDTNGIYYFITGDDAVGSTGTVQCVIEQNNSLTLSGGSLSGTITNAILSMEAFPLPVEKMEKNIPTEFSLQQNYPNPFNPSTTIAFGIPERSHVTLKIYDVLGKEAATLINDEIVAAGYYTMQWNAAHMPSGVYFYKLQAGTFMATKKLVLMK